MKTISLQFPPVGVKFIFEQDLLFKDIEIFQGISYCHAVSEATFGKELIIDKKSIKVSHHQ